MAHPGQDKYRGGCRVAGETRFERLEHTSKSYGSFNARWTVCLSADASTRTVRQLQVGPERNAHRCVHDELVEPGAICLPFIQSTSSSTSQSQKGGSNASVGCTFMDRTAISPSISRPPQPRHQRNWDVSGDNSAITYYNMIIVQLL
ncbi:Hypothetical predicted protein [Paramuricea clavata]|uniref:Uncharacterized protein n=1 Tax=Paramuricea clavata TaxID=317549 RepID=A0A7D9IPK3_PARCT|nr:Hypothetical predicted protein [Paramuricea clavata]